MKENLKKFLLILLILIFGFFCFLYGKDFNKTEAKEGYFVEQGYSFKIPLNWKETTELGSLAFLNEEEDNGENPFKSYLFLLKDDLNGRSSEQYFNFIKTQIENSSETMEVVEEKDDGDIHVIAIKTFQEGYDYVIGMAFAKGKGDAYFVVSLNTLESRWEEMKPIFEETYKTLDLR